MLAVENPALANQHPGTVINQFTSAFKQSLPAERQASGVIKRFELVAKPTVAGLIPPYQLPIWAYNDQTPGPVLRVKAGPVINLNNGATRIEVKKVSLGQLTLREQNEVLIWFAAGTRAGFDGLVLDAIF